MIEIQTYAELKTFYVAFKTGKINLLIIESDGGLGKTHTAESVVPEAYFIRGHATALSIYMKIHNEHPDLIVFDDVETLLRNRTNTTLLKQILDTKAVKTVNYHTTHTIGGSDIPPQITTSAKAMILCNDLKKEGKDTLALLSRGHHIKFIPSHEEIFKQMRKFAKDADILREIKKILKDAGDFNLRTYVKSVELRLSGLDWQTYLHKMCLIAPNLVAFRKVEREMKGKKVKERIAAFVGITGKSERTYHYLKKKLRVKR